MKNQMPFLRSEKTLCCVFNCNSKLYYKVCKDLKFHKLPFYDRDLLLKWINAIKLPRRISYSMIICSKHFTEEDYENTDNNELELKNEAIPSQNLPLIWRNKFLPRQYGRLIKLLEFRGIGRLRLCFEAKLARLIRNAQKKQRERKKIVKILKKQENDEAESSNEPTSTIGDEENVPKVTEIMTLSDNDLTHDESETPNNNTALPHDKEERSLTSEIFIKEEPVSDAEEGEETVEEMLAKMNEESTDDVHVTHVENISRLDFDYEISYESEGYLCNICGEEDCIGHEDKYECAPCGKQFEKIRQLNAHNMCHFEYRKKTSGKTEAICKMCKVSLTTDKISLNQHMLTHAKVKPYVCMLCDQAFYQKISLVQHINGHTIHTKYRCKICGQCFATETDLDIHVRKHKVMKQEFSCRECGQKFKNKQECWAHLNSHYRARSMRPGIACDVCGRVLSTRATLREHMFIHSGEKPFECQLCGRKIRHRANFIIHVQGHSLGQPHLCNLCGMSFSKKHELATHTAAEHPEDRPYLCIICGLRFRTEMTFHKHAITHDASIEGEV